MVDVFQPSGPVSPAVAEPGLTAGGIVLAASYWARHRARSITESRITQA